MSDLIQQVVNGKINASTAVQSTKEQKETRGTTNLGEDAFLQLLVCEMQNQDPLEPTTNTEWIAQLATFSQLEELQSLSKTAEASRIYSLVGKQVIISTQDIEGNQVLKSGKVDFISTSGSETKYSVNGNLYSMENLYSIVDYDYLYDKNKPGIEKEVNFSFNGDNPEDLTFVVNMGEDPAKADDVAVCIGNTVFPAQYTVLNGNKLTIKGEAFQQLEQGTYKLSLVFDDKNYTTIEDKVVVNVYNPHPAAETETADESADTTVKD